MSRIKEAQDKLVALSTKALAIAENQGNIYKSATDQRAALAPIEAQIATTQNDLEFFKKSATFAGNMADLGGTIPTPGGSRVGQRGFIGQAPALGLDGATQLEMFKSIQNGMPFVTKGSDSSNVDPARTPGQFMQPVSVAHEPTRILDLIPTLPTDASSMDYYVATSTSSAAAVEEGGLKPASTVTLDRQNAGATKIAHWTDVTEEALEDFAPFSQFLAGEMMAGLIDAENEELLWATGADEHKFKGIMLVDGTQTYTREAEDTILDALEIGGTMLRASGRFITPTAYVMNPLDYSRARRIKSTTGEYIAGDPTKAGPAELWGSPVVLTSEMEEGWAVVADFGQACNAWIRKAPTYKTNANGQLFQRNKVEVIAEERIIFAVTAPAAICVVDISDPA